MYISAYSCSMPKEGSSEQEYEDAFYPPESGELYGKSFSFAVADGATETSYSKAWANLLVEAYCAEEFNRVDLTDSVQTLQTKWRESVGSKQLPWYAEEKIRSGAFSSLLGILITEDVGIDKVNVGIWEAKAVGDSCLFQVRDDELLTSFPFTHSDQFNNRPVLISSNSSSNIEFADSFFSSLHGDCQTDDVFFLFTDALAYWFLSEAENEKKPWRFTHKDPKRFERWIKTLRKKGALRNDDVTMYRIEIRSDEYSD